MRKHPSYLEDIDLPGHEGRPRMAMRDREWLTHLRNRSAVAKLWSRLHEAPRTACGGFGFVLGEQLEDDGIPEVIVSHWRDIHYTDTGERVERIPGGMIARDLGRLGLGQAEVIAGTAVVPARRPSAALAPPPPAPRDHRPLVIRRRGEGVPRG